MSESFGCKRFPDRIGVLVAQLGTPDAPTAGALRPYLRQFLWDRRVIEVPRLLWWFILHFIVLVTRPRRSARLYRRIWTAEGSPLLAITRRQTEKIGQALAAKGIAAEIEFGMRYGSPSLESAIDRLIERGCTRILLFPMYPQYSGATTGSTCDAVFARLLKRRWVPTLRVAAPYYRDIRYLEALVETIDESYELLPVRPERLVLSYHGIPEAYIQKGDPYCCMCTETTMGLLPKLNVPKSEVIHTYQSRFGKEPWLEPYTDQVIEKLAKDGCKDIAVACPGFTADCLETLDELGHEGRELFKKHGGKRFHLVPCLNDHPTAIRAFTEIIIDELGNWVTAENQTSAVERCPVELAKRG